MAMTKAEQAHMQKLKDDLRMALALRWSGYVEPTMIPPPQSGTEFGWAINVHTNTARECWSQGARHGDGRDPSISGSQNGIYLYRSRRDALTALRLRQEQRAAKMLADLDALINAEGSDA